MEIKKISELETLTPTGEDLILVEDTSGATGHKVTLNKLLAFLQGTGGVDFRINAFGSNYIRYENGLQICWGEFTITNNIETASGNVYARTVNMQHNYPVVFKTVHQSFVQSAHNLDGTRARELWVGDVYSYTNKIFGIRISSPVQILDTIDMKFNYFAIGKWK